MSGAARIDVARLVRIATLLFAVVAAALVYVSYQPGLATLQRRIDDGENELRSDDLTFNAEPVLRAERARLRERYAALFAQNAQAVFVRELATMVRRHGVTLASTSVTPEPAAAVAGPPALLVKTHAIVELRGTYRALLATIGDLSTGSEIVDVGPPSLSASAGELVATVPLDIYEPQRSPVATPHRSGR